MTVSLVKEFTDEEIESFIAGYCEAMLWANNRNDDDPEDDSFSPSDWAMPCNDWALRAFDPESQTRIETVCDDFLQLAYSLLRQAMAFAPNRPMAYQGHDLALTAAGHGAGFWDRGYPSALGRALTDASRNYGADCSFGADGIVHYYG